MRVVVVLRVRNEPKRDPAHACIGRQALGPAWHITGQTVPLRIFQPVVPQAPALAAQPRLQRHALRAVFARQGGERARLGEQGGVDLARDIAIEHEKQRRQHHREPQHLQQGVAQGHAQGRGGEQRSRARPHQASSPSR